ncbi:MAG TPA: hypothetical protein VFO21_04530 [Vicinamibacterales bacterium]|nr:hypothetical protein [Vicinamibacterales bacterium]
MFPIELERAEAINDVRATHGAAARLSLVAQVFPEVPVRRWVLSLPHRLRYMLA